MRKFESKPTHFIEVVGSSDRCQYPIQKLVNIRPIFRIDSLDAELRETARHQYIATKAIFKITPKS